MKITSREPDVVHSDFSVDGTGHHPVVVIDIMSQEYFIQRTPLWVLLEASCHEHAPPHCCPLSRFNTLVPSSIHSLAE